MLLHSCDLATLRKGEALGALVRARDAGKVRFAGYSGDNEAAAHAATLPEVAVVQTSISLADQANIDRVLPAARKNNVGVMAKRPIANAAWKDLGEQPGMYKSYAATYTDRLAKMRLDPAALGFNGPREQVWPELALRFTLSQPGVHTAIIGTTNPENAKANLDAAEKGPLPEDVVRKIREAFRAADPTGAWAGQT
jgi:aryl-alcohol dehydrogenase-like predicted oxidoreductase